MKTETQIAEENIKKYKEVKELWMARNEDSEKYFDKIEVTIESHKASCERFLVFLKEREICRTNLCPLCLREVRDKITDLKQAIKLYDEVGI